MIEIDLEELGSYKPGFLHLHVNTDLNLQDLNAVMKNHKKEFSTFLHEYIHFLQNITTVSGLYQSVYYFEILKHAIHKVSDSDGTFQIPLELGNEFNRESQKELNRIYVGDSKKVERVIYQRFFYEECKIESITGDSINPIKYYVEYFDINKRTSGIFTLGSTAIKEFLAHSIQNKFFEVAHPDIPYIIVDLMISKEVPDLADKQDLKIIMCEAALMSLHPAQQLITSIERLKELAILPTTPLEMYIFVLDETRSNVKVENIFNKVYNDLITTYTGVLRTDVFNSEVQWIQYILSEGRKLRFSEPDYLLKLVSDSGIMNQDFFRIVDLIGTPFFTNRPKHGHFIPPNNIAIVPKQMYLLSTVSEVINILMGQSHYGMRSFCGQPQTKQMVTDHCNSKPWKNMNNYSLCPFCQLWKTWGIHLKEPV